MRPDLHHLLLSQVDRTKLKDLEFQFLHRSTVSKLRLDRLLNQNRGFLQSVPIHLASKGALAFYPQSINHNSQQEGAMDTAEIDKIEPPGMRNAIKQPSSLPPPLFSQ